MKSGWKNRKSAPLLIQPFLVGQWDRVCWALRLNPCFVLFPVKFHSGLPDSTRAHRSRILEFLRRGVEGFLSCGSGFHGFILS